MLENLSYIFSVLILGIFFAVVFYPLSALTERKLFKSLNLCKKYRKISRIFSVLFCYLLVCIFLVGLLFLLYRTVYRYLCCISWEAWGENLVISCRDLFQKIPFFSHPSLKEQGVELCFSALEAAAEKTVKYMGNFLMALPKIFGKIGLGVIISIYLLVDRERYLLFFQNVTEDEKKMRQLRTSQRIFFGYWKGQSLDALLMGVLIGGGLFLLGVPLGPAIGVFAGIGNLIPYLGPFIAYGSTIFICVVEGKGKVLFFSLLYLIVIQQVDGSYIGPKLVGKYVNLPPLIIVLAVLIGGTLFGLFGMMLAVPVTAILRESFMKK